MKEKIANTPPPMPSTEAFSVTIAEATKLTGLGATKIFGLLKEGRLRRVKVGRRTLIRVDDLRALMEGAAPDACYQDQAAYAALERADLALVDLRHLVPTPKGKAHVARISGQLWDVLTHMESGLAGAVRNGIKRV